MRNLLRLVIALFLGASLATGSRAGVIQDFLTSVKTPSTLISSYGGIAFIGNVQHTVVNLLGKTYQISNFGSITANTVASSVTNQAGESVLAVYTGKLTLNLPNGEKFEIQGGEGAAFDKTGAPKGPAQSLSTLMADPVYKTMLVAAAKSAATQLAANTDSSKTAELTRALAAIVQSVSAADPAATQSIVETTVGELTKGGKSDEATLKSINVVVAAAANGSKEDKSTLTGYALVAAGKNGATGVTTVSLSDANIQKALGSVFTTETASSSIDITIASPSSP